MAAARPATIQEGRMSSEGADGGGSHMGLLEGIGKFPETLLSLEKLDRTSPELWPEQIPGLGQYVRQRSSPLPSVVRGLAPWKERLTQADLNLMHQLGTLSTTYMIVEVKKLHDLAYKLGEEEAKEMTRGKYLNIFKAKQPR